MTPSLTLCDQLPCEHVKQTKALYYRVYPEGTIVSLLVNAMLEQQADFITFAKLQRVSSLPSGAVTFV